jgi:hypothetical protein
MDEFDGEGFLSLIISISLVLVRFFKGRQKLEKCIRRKDVDLLYLLD